MSIESHFRIMPCGDTALTVEFGKVIDAVTNERVLSFDATLARRSIRGVRETVPTYRSLLVHYDPCIIGFDELAAELTLLSKEPSATALPSRQWRVPVVYGGGFGVDLDTVARTHDLSPEDVIARHSSAEYRVAMIGFTPGFAYLSGLDPVLSTPRRPQPRPTTPPGTISIGGQQACVQCLAGPSGWHLLGRTPVRTFYPRRDPIFLMEPGERVSFFPIKAPEFERLERMAERGEIVAEVIAS